MTTSILINALGQALFESCGQALLIYIILQLFMQLFPSVSSKYRYDVNYLGLVIISCWFLANLVKIYLHNAAMPHYNMGMYSNLYYTKHAPTLLQQAEAFITTYAKYITGLYLIGLMLHAFKLMGGLVRIHHIRKQKNLREDSSWSAKAAALAQKLKLVKKVSLYFSGHVQVPLTIGHLKPIVIFPLALINNLDTEQVEAILLHELAHIKRHDYLLNILQCVMETILCFNPFVWLISKTIRTEREYCCDDMVVEDEECNSFTYAKALFVIAQQNSQSYALAMASTGSKKYPLLNRIKRLNHMKTQDSLPKFHLLVVLAVVAIGTLLAWGIPQYSQARALNRKKVQTLVRHLSVDHRVSVTTNIIEKVNINKVLHKNIAKIIYNDTATNVRINDTTINPAGKKYKIVIENDNGSQKVYNSIDDLPAKDKEEFLKENPALVSLGSLRALDFKMLDTLKFASMETLKMNPEWKKQMKGLQLQMKEQFNNPAWRQQMKEMSKQFDSPEWHKQVEELSKHFNDPAFKKQMEDMQLKMKQQLESPEWKKQMEEIKLQSKKLNEQLNSAKWRKQMTDMKIQNERMRKMMNSPEWRKRQEEFKKEADEIQKKYNSPEWHKQMEDMQKKMLDQIMEYRDKAAGDSVKTAN